MSRGFPSMTALLGLIAVAGYQNRDKISEMLGQRPQTGGQIGGPDGLDRAGQTSAGGLGGLGGLGSLGGLAGGGGLGSILGGLAGQGGGTSAGGMLSGGLGDLMDSFRRSGHGETADSWVGHGPNREVSPAQLEQAIDPEVIDTLTQQTGLSREELLSRLSRTLPDAVDRYTPEGRVPSDSDRF